MSQFLTKTEQLVNNIKNDVKSVAAELPFDLTIKLNNSIPCFLKIGNLLGQNGNNYPALLDIKSLKGLAFQLNDSNREEIHLALQHYALQMIQNSTEGHIEMNVVDTKKMGSNFRYLRRIDRKILKEFVADSERTKVVIDDIHQKSISIITECLTRYSSLSEYNEKSGHVQPFRILLIADFPHGINNFEKLETLLQNADEAGLFVFATFDREDIDGLSIGNRERVDKLLLNNFLCLEEFGDSANDFYKKVEKDLARSPLFPNYTLQLDRKDISLENINNQVDSMVATIVVNENASDGIRVPIGKSAGQTHYFTFGYESDNFHAIIGGQSGKGKSVLLNNIIARSMEAYSSDELRFVIIDCGGTGFHEFDTAPNIQLMCRSSSVETCYQAVQYIEDELAKREVLFKENGVSDLKQYIKKTQKTLPRLICIIDEFHVLYTGKEKFSSYFDTVLVDRAIRIGRKFGIHLVTCTQSLGGGVRRSILDNIPLRIALGMTTDQSNGFLGLKNDAAANLERGVAVYNAQNGNLTANKLVKINNIQEEDIERIKTLAKSTFNNAANFDKIII